jgi:two-component system chemotaxis response regulator CheB
LPKAWPRESGRRERGRARGHDIVVIGASAGGVDALVAVVRALPADLAAAVFVVLHFPPSSTSALSAILSREGPLPASTPSDREAIEPGRIYVARPDYHLLVEPGYVRLTRGPKENGHRPAVDPLLRTAARAYGPRVVGVVLSGALDDGAAGLSDIKARGGVALIQDPDEALFPGMPRSAAERVDVDFCLPVAKLGAELARLSREPVRDEGLSPVSEAIESASEAAEANPRALKGGARIGRPSDLTCPECHGSLYEEREGKLDRYRCRVGHAYSEDTLFAAQSDGLEAALWVALRALEEQAELTRRIGARARDRGNSQVAARFDNRARLSDERAALIREALLGEAKAG